MKTGQDDWQWLDVHFRPQAAGQQPEYHRYRMPLSLETISFADMLPRWFAAYERAAAACTTVLSAATFQLEPYPRFMALSAAAELLAGTLYPPPDQDKQLLLERRAAIAEGLGADDAAWLEQQVQYRGRSFRLSLETLRDELGQPHHWYLDHQFGPDWPQRFTDARNGYAHGRNDPRGLDEVRLPIASDALALLLRIHLLKHLGLGQDELAAALARDPNYRDMEYRRIERHVDP